MNVPHPRLPPPKVQRSNRYSIWRLLREGLRSQRGWSRAWAKASPRARYRVVIVGGGGHGLSTAFHLAAEHGITDVAVLERGPIGLGNVGRNTTIIRSNYFHPDNIRFYELSLRLWERLERDLNFNAMVSQRGTLNLFHTEAQRDLFTRRANQMRLLGVDAEALDAAKVRRLVPLVDLENGRYPVLGGFLQRRGGTVRHDAVAWGYARAASAAGIDVIEHCEVTGLTLADGRVRGVQTARGPIEADTVCLAVAGHSSVLAAMAGLQLPIETHVLQAFVSEPVKPLLDVVLTYGAGHFYISQSDKGGLVFGGAIDGYNTYAQRGTLPMVEEVAAAGVTLLPALARLKVLRQWGGVMDMTMDGSPIISRTPVPGLILNGGWCYGGFKAIPAGGLTTAHLIARGEPHPCAEHLDLGRFAQGRPVDERGVGPFAYLH
ncbi:MAG: sarcosine oxidase subunit beta family protein [Gammaproteobacteria bacterium]|nr:sarcosine oxidase subunit beta family protein [Gammaproteobacteria bacterium]MBV9727209.1 sarcosine oxidase subunit beta family protein [Gammaproteobacteria bacterium]